jgi:hypothetical protein
VATIAEVEVLGLDSEVVKYSLSECTGEDDMDCSEFPRELVDFTSQSPNSGWQPVPQ